jgi:hypothetical protein
MDQVVLFWRKRHYRIKREFAFMGHAIRAFPIMCHS